MGLPSREAWYAVMTASMRVCAVAAVRDGSMEASILIPFKWFLNRVSRRELRLSGIGCSPPSGAVSERFILRRASPCADVFRGVAPPIEGEFNSPLLCCVVVQQVVDCR